MKTTERHHLKTNELAQSVARTREVLVERQRSITAALVVAAVLVVAIAGYFGQRSRTQSRAGAMLAEAMSVMTTPVTPPMSTTGGTTPPPQPGAYQTEAARAQAAIEKFMAAANEYPSTQAGLLARYQAAVQMAETGKLVDSEQQFLELIKLDSSGLFGRMAKLGLAEVQVRAGNFEQGIKSYNEVVARPDADLPLDGVLMQLARAYTVAGKPTEAKQTLNRIIDEFPQSPYVGEAKRQVEALAGGASS